MSELDIVSSLWHRADERARQWPTPETPADFAEDVVVYDAHGSYVGNVGGEWFAWPADKSGWLRRSHIKEPNTDTLPELSGWQAYLSLRLSGWRP